MSRGPEDYNNLEQTIRAASGAPSIAQIAFGFGISVVAVQVSGTWTGTLVFEGSQDNGSTWTSMPAFGVSTLLQVSSVTANGNYFVIVGGYTNVRVRASSLSSGTANVLLTASTANAPVSFVTCTTNPNQALGGTSPSAPGTTVGTTLTGLDSYDKCVIYAKLQGATGGVLDVYIQSSVDGGTTWYDVCHFTQLAAGGGAVGWLISLTRGQTVNANTPVSVNSASGTPALAANTLVPHAFGNALRVVYVAGASTSAGAAQTITAMLST